MEIDTLTARTSIAKHIKDSVSSASGSDLLTLIRHMKDNDDWKSGELNSLILLNSSAKKIVLTVMHDRTEVKSFQSGESVAVQIIEGKIKVETNRKTVILNEGQIFVLQDKKKFSLTTLEESSFILTMLTGSH